MSLANMARKNMDLYIYKLEEVLRVVDGDTYDLILDVGFEQRQASRFRLAQYDTPEIFWNKASELEREAGHAAIEAVKEWLEERVDVQLYVRTHKSDSFGRWLVDIFTDSGDDLGGYLAQQELATRWPTRWRDVYDTTILD